MADSGLYGTVVQRGNWVMLTLGCAHHHPSSES